VDDRLVRGRWDCRRLGDHLVGDTEAAKWHFECTWKGEPGAFDGSTVARLDHGRIVYLREYATSAPLYDWTGTWRD